MSSCRSTTKHFNGVGVDVLAVVDHLLASFGDAMSGRATLIAQVLTGIDPAVPTTHWLECNSSDVRCTCLWRAQRCRLVSRECDKTDGVAWAAHMHHYNNELRICQQHMICDLQILCFKESNRLIGAGGKNGSSRVLQLSSLKSKYIFQWFIIGFVNEFRYWMSATSTIQGVHVNEQGSATRAWTVTQRLTTMVAATR